MRPLLLIFLLSCISFVGRGQQQVEQQLLKKIAVADNNARIKLLGELADFYYTYQADKKGDSVLQQQIMLAEMSADKNLVLQILFSDAINNIPQYSSKETYERALAFIDKGIEYAKEINRPDYESLGYIRKAILLRKRNRFEEAIQQTSLALPLIDNNDSLKAVLYLEQGEIALAKGDAVGACKHLNTAYDIAYGLKNRVLQSTAHHGYAKLYTFLEDSALAKKNLLESLELNLAAKNDERLIQDYMELSKRTDKRQYLDQAIQLANSLGSRRAQVATKRLMFYYLMAVERDAEKMIAYLKNNPEVEYSFKNQGSFYEWTIGMVYQYGKQPEKALQYLLPIEKDVETAFETFARWSYYESVGRCYEALKQTDKAITYYEKALAVGKELGVPTLNSRVSRVLSKAYAVLGDYKKAFDYSEEHLGFEKQLKEKLKDREVAMLNVSRIDKMHQQDMDELQKETLRTRNLQYIGITIATIAFFVFLFLVGMFPVSRTATRMLSFFAFICLFEFIILLIDNWLHHAAHGEPLKIWLAKIGIIAILLPLHHYLDHLAYMFLTSHKLEKLRHQFSVKKIVNKIKLSEHKVVDKKIADPASVDTQETHDTIA